MPEKQNLWFLNEKVGIDKYGAVVGMVPLQCCRTFTVMTCPAVKKKSWKSSEFLKDLCDWNKKTCLIVKTQSSLHDPGVGCPERTAWPALLPRCAALHSCRCVSALLAGELSAIHIFWVTLPFMCVQNYRSCVVCCSQGFAGTTIAAGGRSRPAGPGAVSSLPAQSEPDNVFSSPPLSGLFFRLTLLF